MMLWTIKKGSERASAARSICWYPQLGLTPHFQRQEPQPHSPYSLGEEAGAHCFGSVHSVNEMAESSGTNKTGSILLS